MTKQIVAKRYAKALLALGCQNGQAKVYEQQLGELAALQSAIPELTILDNPSFTFEERKSLLNALLAELNLGPVLNNFLQMLMDRGRIGMLTDLAAVYQELLDEVNGIKRGTVISVTPLDPVKLEQVKDLMHKITKVQVELSADQDTNLIGGMVVRIGDLVLDGSVRTQLTQIRDSLTRGDYV